MKSGVVYVLGEYCSSGMDLEEEINPPYCFCGLSPRLEEKATGAFQHHGERHHQRSGSFDATKLADFSWRETNSSDTKSTKK